MQVVLKPLSNGIYAESAYEKKLKYANSYQRLPMLMSETERGRDWFIALGERWSSCDNHWRYATELEKVFRYASRELLDCLMNSEEFEFYKRLPDHVNIYRGQDACFPLGLSWSLDEKIARKFPFYSRYECDHPALFVATVPKSHVVAVKLGRDESELISYAGSKAVLKALLWNEVVKLPKV